MYFSPTSYSLAPTQSHQTYVGTILISINPYKLLPIYASNTVQRYVGKRIGAVSPHIFALAEAAYRALEETGRPQSIVIRYARSPIFAPDLP